MNRRRAVSLACEAVALAGVPAVLVACALLNVQQTALLSLLVVVGCLLLFFAGFEQGRPRLRDTMPVAVLAALAAAGRMLFAAVPNFKPVSAIAIIAGAAFGRRSGFMVGALAALVSNFFFGQGPWTPWQMYAWGLVGWLGGVLAGAGLFGSRAREGRKPLSASSDGGTLTGQDEGMCAERETDSEKAHRNLKGKAALLSFGFLSGPLYGVILNVWSIIGFYHPETLGQALLVYAAAVPFDIVHGVATVVFLLALYFPWQRKLARIKCKFALQT